MSESQFPAHQRTELVNEEAIARPRILFTTLVIAGIMLTVSRIFIQL